MEILPHAPPYTEWRGPTGQLSSQQGLSSKRGREPGWRPRGAQATSKGSLECAPVDSPNSGIASCPRKKEERGVGEQALEHHFLS